MHMALAQYLRMLNLKAVFNEISQLTLYSEFNCDSSALLGSFEHILVSQERCKQSAILRHTSIIAVKSLLSKLYKCEVYRNLENGYYQAKRTTMSLRRKCDVNERNVHLVASLSLPVLLLLLQAYWRVSFQCAPHQWGSELSRPLAEVCSIGSNQMFSSIDMFRSHVPSTRPLKFSRKPRSVVSLFCCYQGM